MGTVDRGLLTPVLGLSVTNVSKSSLELDKMWEGYFHRVIAQNIQVFTLYTDLIWQMFVSDLHTVKEQGELSPLELEK